MKGDATGQGVVPLRTILRNILNLIDSFEARYKEGLDSYDQEFQELKQFSENLKTDPEHLCKEGEKSVNRKKNRYKDILPFDYTRVILGDYGDIPGSDYINANFIKGASGSSAYIACQGPLPHTVNDFWRMVVECEVQVIVMACNEQESGKHKCENYWVEEEGVEREFGQVTVWLKKSRQVCPDFLVRTMKIRYPNAKGDSEERSVCQFHYSAWPDHGVPLKVRPLLDMVRLIRDCQTSETLPVLVHCSAGCGRTGTICAIDYVWGLLRLGKLTSDFSLFNLVRDMRRQRIAMVQTKDQYILVHRAVRELFEEQLKIIDSHPYANVDINGLPLEIRAELEEPVYETVQFLPCSTAKGVDDQDVVDSRSKQLLLPMLVGNKPPPPPIPSEPIHLLPSSVATSKHEKEAENHQRQLEQEQKLMKVSPGNGGSCSSISIKVNSTTPSPSSESQGGGGTASGSDSKDNTSERKKDIISLSDDKLNGKRGDGGASGSVKQKSSLLRNPSIVRLKAFFEKSKDSDKEKKGIPTLSRAKSDVSSSSRFYANFASTFSSRGSRRNSPSSNAKNSSPPNQAVIMTSSIEEPRVSSKAPVEKIKSKPALLAKPSMAVKRSKSLRIVRGNEGDANPPIRDHVQLISANSIISSDIPDSSKLVRASISSSTSSSSSQSPLETSRPIKVNVKKGDVMPKGQKPQSKSAAIRSDSLKVKKPSQDHHHHQRNDSFSTPKKPDVPLKPQLIDMTTTPSSKGGIYGATRIKIGISDDIGLGKSSNSSSSKINGKIKKYGTVNPKMILSSSGTLLTRSQSHVWQPSKSTTTQVPVRIFSDENLSQVGMLPDGRTGEPPNNRSVDQTDHHHHAVKLIRKQSLPITKLFSSKVKPHPVNNSSSPSYDSSPPLSKEQPRSLTLTSHSSFLEARKRVPKTNPYANYTPSGDTTQSYKEKGGGGGSPLTQFHFGENVPLLRNSNGNATMGNSSESSSNPGTPRNSLPGTPTQSIDVLYSPLSLNTSSSNNSNYASSKNHSSRPILKGSLSSTPSESDERLDLGRPPHLSSSSNLQSQVPTNITGPQKISSVRIAVGMRERRNSFRQAVWKEDQGPTATSIPVEKDKSENIYITTTSSVPYFVKSSAMPMSNHHHPNNPNPMSSSSYKAPVMSTTTTSSGVSRPAHRDYEPIWPDPGSSTNAFKIGPATTSTTTVLINADPHTNVTIGKSGSSNFSTNNPFFNDDKALKPIQNKFEPKVQDRMAEIKVLLEELRAPSKVEEAKQRSMSNGGPSQIPLRKPSDKMPRAFIGEVKSNGSAGTPGLGAPSTSTANNPTTSLKHHRSLRAPSRPQYEQGFACFSFRKPSSFESITDQLYAEDNMHLARNHGKDMSSSSYEPSKPRFQEESSFQQPHQPQGDPTGSSSSGYSHRLNDYVSLRTCRSASAPRVKPSDGSGGASSSSDYPQQIHHQQQLLGKSDSMPVPPPRSKRMGIGRRDQGNDYANVSLNQSHHPQPAEKYGGGVWMENGVGNNHNHNHNNSSRRLHNGTSTTTTAPIRKESSSSSSELDQYDNHYSNGNGQEFARLTSTSSIPLTNGNTGAHHNAPPTSPKAIIRALGLFQAKAANVRSRFASWTENKERSASKRGGNNYGSSSSALTKRHERSSERGGFNETLHPSRSAAPPPSSIAGPSSTASKHQYL